MGYNQAIAQACLVDLAKLDPSLIIHLRYGTLDNFTGKVLYTHPKAYLQKEAAEALVRVQRNLAREDLGLLIWDAYRPFSVQEALWKVCPNSDYVARPVRDASGGLAEGSRHSRGCAVDLALVEGYLANQNLYLGQHDDMDPKAAQAFVAETRFSTPVDAVTVSPRVNR